MGKIESAGVYLGIIAESAVSLTKNGFPQWVARLKATQRYIEEAADIAHFQGQGLLTDGQPGYVDYTAFSEDTLAYLVLYKSNTEISPATELLNVKQLNAATGWQAPDFSSLEGLVGQEILFRMSEKKAYTNPEGKTFGGDGSLEVSWIDNKTAAPQRQLKSLDTDAIKGLMSKVSGYAKVKPAATAAKPAASAASPSTPTAPAALVPSAPAPAPAATPAPKRRAAPRTPPTPTPAPIVANITPTSAPPASLPSVAEITMEGAWEHVQLNKGGIEDSKVEDAWLSAMGEIAGPRKPEELSGAEFARVRDLVMQKIAA